MAHMRCMLPTVSTSVASSANAPAHIRTLVGACPPANRARTRASEIHSRRPLRTHVSRRILVSPAAAHKWPLSPTILLTAVCSSPGKQPDDQKASHGRPHALRYAGGRTDIGCFLQELGCSVLVEVAAVDLALSCSLHPAHTWLLLWAEALAPSLL